MDIDTAYMDQDAVDNNVYPANVRILEELKERREANSGG